VSRRGVVRLRQVRIVVDARVAAEVVAGRGRYVRELLRALQARDDDHEYLLLTREAWDGLPRDDRFSWRVVPGPDPLWSLRAAPVARGGAVLFATASYLLAAVSPIPPVATVFDLVAFDPETSPPRGALAERVTLPLALGRRAAFVCISAAARNDLVRHFPTAARRTAVTSLAAAPGFAVAAAGASDAPRRLGLPERYVLSVGTREPRKNLVRTIEAFRGLPQDLRADRRLVIVGRAGWGEGPIDAAIAAAGDLVHVAGFVNDDDLPAIYAGADAFVYASFHEGFGLPVLEAMAVGTPVVTSNVSSLPEVAGDAAITVDPHSVEAIQDGLARALEPGIAADLARRGRARAASFSWDQTAAETLEVLTLRARAGG
jgi:alpha-1,3-rhamnosyl/mannosyltransferase